MLLAAGSAVLLRPQSRRRAGTPFSYRKRVVDLQDRGAITESRGRFSTNYPPAMQFPRQRAWIYENVGLFPAEKQAKKHDSLARICLKL